MAQTYGGTQTGTPYLWMNPETGEVEYREGDPIEVSPSTRHQPLATTLLKQAPYYAAPLGAAGLDALIGPATTGFSGAATGSVAGHVAPGAAGAAAPAAAPISTGIGSATFLPAAAPATAAVAPATAAVAPAAATSLWGKLAAQPWFWPSVIAGGSALGGAYLQSRAAGKAADAQQQATDKALALQANIYGQQRADLAPYRGVGDSAITTLGALMGLPQQAQAPYTPAATTGLARRQQPGMPTVGQAVPRSGPPPSNLSDLTRGAMRPEQARTQSGYVQIQAPDGEVRAVPMALAARMQQAGGKVVG